MKLGQIIKTLEKLCDKMFARDWGSPAERAALIRAIGILGGVESMLSELRRKGRKRTRRRVKKKS